MQYFVGTTSAYSFLKSTKEALSKQVIYGQTFIYNRLTTPSKWFPLYITVDALISSVGNIFDIWIHSLIIRLSKYRATRTALNTNQTHPGPGHTGTCCIYIFFPLLSMSTLFLAQATPALVSYIYLFIIYVHPQRGWSQILKKYIYETSACVAWARVCLISKTESGGF